MNSAEHRWVGSAMHDRIIGALETCCRQGEMLRIQNRHVDREQHQIAIPGAPREGRGESPHPVRPARVGWRRSSQRRAKLGPSAYVFGGSEGEFQDSFKTAWESLLLLANGHDTTRAKPGARVDRAQAARRSTCTGTTCDMKAPADCWRTASTSASSS